MPKFKFSSSIIPLILLAVFCAIFYSNSLLNPFIWDDEALVVQNPIIRSPAGLLNAFTSDLYSGVDFGSNFYRPLQAVSYLWDYHFWRLDPYGYHLTNIALQILVSFLVFLFSFNFVKKREVAFGAALLFALSPLNTEAVTYISGRADMLLGLFLLSSFLLFIRGYRFFSWIAFILALLSKELAVVFPGVFILLPKGRVKKNRQFCKISPAVSGN
jgi:protein O-mannosyl-transferase